MRFLAGCFVLAAACSSPPKPTTPSPSPQPQPVADPEPAPSPGEPAPQVIELDPMRIEVVTDDRGERRVVAYDAGELLDAANQALLAGRVDDALRQYDQLLDDFADSPLVVPARYNAGIAHEQKREWEAAIARYEAVATGDAPAEDAIDALIRMGAVMAELERWTDATAVFERLLERDDLTPSDRIQGLARLGYVLLEAKDYVGAEEVLRSGLGYYEEIAADTVLDTDYFVAMCQYYLAQIPHRQFAAIPIRMPDKQVRRDLEAKADRILIAHDRYLKTVELGNGYWASAAGYQIASMQKELWDALVVAPIPPQLIPEAAELYVTEVHKHSRQFLEKALDTHRKNAAFADRSGVMTVWTEASRREAEKIADILARESAGEIVLPEAGGGASTTLDMGPDSGRTPHGDYVPGRVDL